jgi:hypothetical protein
MNWRPISSAPDDGTHILIRYFKGGSSNRTRVSKTYIVIEGYLEDGAWWDALDRLIVACGCKNPKNFVTHWMPMPEEPEDE